MSEPELDVAERDVKATVNELIRPSVGWTLTEIRGPVYLSASTPPKRMDPVVASADG
jgi:hypothetical protein